MPSQTRRLFVNKLIPDVRHLIENHEELNPPGRGRRYLGHITRSGVVMLCAAWELYAEEIVGEAVNFLVKDCEDPDFLPDHVKGKIAKAAKNDSHDFGALRLCGSGWKQVYYQAAMKDCARLNTPKFGPVSEIFKDWLNIHPDELENGWRHTREELNEFVALRGEIAHRGADAGYVRRDRLMELVRMIDAIVVDTDNLLARRLRETSNSGRRPWNIIPVHD